MAIRDILDSEFILFGGKGGLGKTTCTAVTAIALLPKKTLAVWALAVPCLLCRCFVFFS